MNESSYEEMLYSVKNDTNEEKKHNASKAIAVIEELEEREET